jgi:hypothetical protein
MNEDNNTFGIELAEGEELSEETFAELNNGKEPGEDE